jgi:hypothetical protein
MAKSKKFFRVFTEGDSTDGRVIQRGWIEQIVKNFNPAKFGARIWLEHIRGTLPDSPFKAYGDVTAVKAEEVDLDGKGKKLALYAEIDATDELVAMNKKRQKIYTSCEIDPNFAKSGECYLVGLAVTDSPASLGTEMLAFAAGATANPLTGRKQSPDNLFTAAQEAELEFETGDPAPGETFFAKIKALLGTEKKDADGRFADVGKALEVIAISQKDSLSEFAAIKNQVAELSTQLKAATDAGKAQETAFAELKAALDKTATGTTRPPATGGHKSATTDC